MSLFRSRFPLDANSKISYTVSHQRQTYPSLFSRRFRIMKLLKLVATPTILLAILVAIVTADHYIRSENERSSSSSSSSGSSSGPIPCDESITNGTTLQDAIDAFDPTIHNRIILCGNSQVPIGFQPSCPISINKSVQIGCDNVGECILDGNQYTRLFEINSFGNLNIEDVKIRNGNGPGLVSNGLRFFQHSDAIKASSLIALELDFLMTPRYRAVARCMYLACLRRRGASSSWIMHE